jgi:hypothetical protein
MTFFVHVAWRVSSDWWDFLATLFGPVLIGLVVNIAVYLVNRLAIRLDLEPRRQELLNLIAGLEDESNGKYSKDVIAICFQACRPVSEFHLGEVGRQLESILSRRGVSRLQSFFRRWFGACCGLYSGLWIRNTRDGPCIFSSSGWEP